MNEQTYRNLLQKMAKLESNQRLLQDAMRSRLAIDRPVGAPIRSPLMLGSPAAAPSAASVSAGAITEDRDWAFNYESTATGQQTALSAVYNRNCVAEQVELTGARSTDPQVDKVNIWTRLQGSGDEAYHRVTQIANPASGAWTYTDNEEMDAYAGNPQPLAFQTPLLIACGRGFKVRRCKVRFRRALAANASAYWIFWLALIRDQQTVTYWQSPEQRTTTVGFLPDALYPVPYFAPTTGGYPSKDLNLLMNENDLLVFMGRGIGAVDPLPEGSVLATVSEPEPEV